MDMIAKEKLLPFTILDGMILVAGCAVSAWLLREPSGWPTDLLEWAIVTAYVLYGVTIVGVLVIGLQFLRGRRQWLLAGELVWLIIAIELWPFIVLSFLEKFQLRELGEGYVKWLVWGSPPLVLSTAMFAWIWHFWRGRPRHWSHRFGLGIAFLQCFPSILLIIEWPDLWDWFW